jgi:hypothetical protein
MTILGTCTTVHVAGMVRVQNAEKQCSNQHTAINEADVSMETLQRNIRKTTRICQLNRRTFLFLIRADALLFLLDISFQCSRAGEYLNENTHLEYVCVAASFTRTVRRSCCFILPVVLNLLINRM